MTYKPNKTLTHTQHTKEYERIETEANRPRTKGRHDVTET